MRVTCLLLLLTGLSAANVQHPLSTSPARETDSDDNEFYQFRWPIRRVAIIGAGPSAVVTYREMTEAGFDVRMFERDSVPGGNWHYTEECASDASVPNAPIPIADFVPSYPPPGVTLPYSEDYYNDSDIRREHRGPKPVWKSLHSNAPSLSQRFNKWPWPVGTKWELSHFDFRNYVRSYASFLHINSNDENPNVSYNTRVERVEKRINEDGHEQGWRLWLKSLEPTGPNTSRATWWTEDFDAVIVASGRYNAPYMPNIPGLAEWAQKFPGVIRHSRQYRRPEPYEDQTVLVIGASASGSEIARDLNQLANTVYLSFRPAGDSEAQVRLNNFLRRVPKNTTFTGEIKQFLPLEEGASIQSGRIELANGTIISGIDSAIFATGFRYSFPFLSQYYDGASYVPQEGSASSVIPFLPLGGEYIRDLYLDLFYIRDPTLAFIAMGFCSQTFLYSDYMSLALAKVWSNTAKLPNNETLWEIYEDVVKQRGGYGKRFMFLGREKFSESVRYFVAWLNDAAIKYGGKQIDGLPVEADEVNKYWLLARFGTPDEERINELRSLGLGFESYAEGGYEYDPFYDDEW